MLAGMNHHEQSPEFTRYLCNPFKQKSKRTTGQKLKQQQYINKEDRCAYNKTKQNTTLTWTTKDQTTSYLTNN
jgi:hypothetical protein